MSVACHMHRAYSQGALVRSVKHPSRRKKMDAECPPEESGICGFSQWQTLFDSISMRKGPSFPLQLEFKRLRLDYLSKFLIQCFEASGLQSVSNVSKQAAVT